MKSYDLLICGSCLRSVTNMENMFRGCENLTKLYLSGFDTSVVTAFGTGEYTGMSNMFKFCRKLTNLVTPDKKINDAYEKYMEEDW